MTPTDKSHKRRCINSLPIDRPRHPAPRSMDVGPATVVSYRKPPRRVIDPGPAPRRDPRPVPIVIGRPPHRNPRRPNIPILDIGTPSAEIIQVLVTNKIRRNITGGDRAFPTAVSLMRPAVEVVGRRGFSVPIVTQSRAVEHIGLPGAKHQGGALAVH